MKTTLEVGQDQKKKEGANVSEVRSVMSQYRKLTYANKFNNAESPKP